MARLLAPSAAQEQELDPLLREAAPRATRRSWHCAALTLAAVATAGVAVAASQGRRRDAFTVGSGAKLGSRLAFLAETQAADSPDAASAWIRYGNELAEKVNKDEDISEALKEQGSKALAVAEPVLKQENAEVEEGEEFVAEAETMLKDSQLESFASKTISELSNKSIASAETMKEAAEKDIEKAQDVVDALPKGMYDYADPAHILAQQALDAAQAMKDRAQQKIESATELEKQAATLEAKSEDMLAASVAVNKTALKEVGVEESTVAFTEAEISKARNLTGLAKDLMAAKAKDEAQYESVADQVKNDTQAIGKARADIQTATEDFAKAQAAQAAAEKGLGDVASLVEQANNITSSAEATLQQLDQTASMAPPAGQNSSQQAEEIEKQRQTARQRADHAKAIMKKADELKAQNEKALADAKASMEAAEQTEKDAKDALAKVNSTEHLQEGLHLQVEELGAVSREDEDASEAIAEVAKGLASLLAESKSQTKNEVNLAESGSKEADALLAEDAAPLVQMMKDEKADADIKEQQTVQGVEAIKAIAGFAQVMQNTAESDVDATKKQMKEYQATMEAVSTGCCSYGNSGICGEINLWCDASKENCLGCSETAVFLDPKPAVPPPPPAAVPAAVK